MNKKSFTMLEILLVALIVGMLITAFRFIFQTNNKEFIQSQTCMNLVYGEVKNYFNNAATGKGLYKGSTFDTVFPDVYLFEVQNLNNVLSFTFSGTNSGTGTNKIINLSGDTIDNKYYCFANNYFVDITGSIDNIEMNAQLLPSVDNPSGILINNDKRVFTGEIEFSFCSLNNECRPLGILMVDRRVSNISYKRCLIRENNLRDCKRYSE